MTSPMLVRLAAALAVLASCDRQTEPQPAPVASRHLGGDSLRPGVNVIVCTADDAGCVPTYAVACTVTWEGDSSGLPPLSPKDQTWCAASPANDSTARAERVR